MTARAATVPFAIVLATAILLRIVLMLAIPLGPRVENRLEGLNDEPAHFNYVRHLAEHHELPIQVGNVRDPGAFERADFEYYQPPLYYLLCALPVHWSGENVGLWICRGFSVACGLLSLPLLAGVLGLLGLGQAERRAGVTFAALLPVHAYFSSVVSNDSLCWLMALAITHELLMRVQGWGPARPQPRFTLEPDLRVGVLLGLGMLTKSAIIAFYPVTVLTYALVLQRERGRGALAGVAVAIGSSLLIAGSWYMRNLLLYGSPLAIDIGFGPPQPGRLELATQFLSMTGTVQSFWFPMRHVPNSVLENAVWAVGLAVVTIHAVAAVAYLASRRPLGAPVVVAVTVLAVVLAGHVALNLRWGEAEGRFLLPALGPIVYLIVAPTFALARRWRVSESLAWAYIVALAVHPYVLLGVA
ncbi:MAG TPA: hypothetical protein VJY35_07730 [Candidatus Eisenbacteria bacterium]|nr:hypothetical protein [Candidatus Eisenbacteria bacterium]